MLFLCFYDGMRFGTQVYSEVDVSRVKGEVVLPLT